MSHWRRMQYAGIGTVANAVQVAIYSRLFKGQILAMATGKYQGQFTSAAQNLGTIWVAEIAILQFALIVYLIYGPFREQKYSEVVPPR